MKHALILTDSGYVDNMIEWDRVAPYEPEEGMSIIPDPEGDYVEIPPQVTVGWHYRDGEWIAPEVSADG